MTTAPDARRETKRKAQKNEQTTAPNRKGVRKNYEKQKTKSALDIGGMSRSHLPEIRQNPDDLSCDVVRSSKEDEMKEPETITVGAVCDRRLVARLDAIAAKHMRSRAKEITLAITKHVQGKESALPSDHIPDAGKMVTAAIMNEKKEKKV